MALIKKIDVDEYFAARRALRLGRKEPVSQPHAIGIEPSGRVVNAPRSVGSSPLEQPSPSAPSTAIPITSDSGRNRLLRPPGSRQR
jgi:hypothetical protein